MIEVGKSLREARERRGLTLVDVERATRIRGRYLGALEDERFDLIPGETYAKGFLRGYAELLGLDGQLFVDEYNARFKEPEPPAPPAPRRRTWTGWKPAAALGAAALAAVIVPLAFRSGGDKAPSLPVAPAPIVRPPKHVPPHPVGRVRRQPAGPPRLVLVAARGDCWLLVRAGSARGPALYEGILRRGGSLRFARRFLWIRMGAPRNLDVRLNDRPQHVPPTTPGNVLLDPRGIRPA